MSFAPFVVLWIILLITAGICLAASRRRGISLAASLSTTILLLIGWFFFRPDSVVAVTDLAGLQWRVDGPAWELTGIALLLLLAALVHASLYKGAAEAAGTRPAWLLGLAATALPVVWTADDRSRVLTLAFFALVWTIAQLRSNHGNPRTAYGWSWPMVSLFPLWLGAAWPAGRPALVLLAGAMLLGGWPFDGRWRKSAPGDGVMQLLINALPVVAGVAVLVSAGATTFGGVAIGVVTVISFSNLVMGMMRVQRHSPDSLAESFGPALAGLLPVFLVWTPAGADRAALLAATRLAVFVPVLFTLIASLINREGVGDIPAAEPRRPALSPGLIGSVAAFAAVGGLPLTAGFAAFMWLYWTWLTAMAGWALILLLIVMLSLWLAAVWQAVRAMAGRFDNGKEAWLRAGVLLLPIVGLLRFNLGSVEPELLAWFIVPLPLIAGLLLGHFIPGRQPLADRIKALLPAMPPLEAQYAQLRRVGQAAVDAVADAMAILDGELGLLWLTGLILLLLAII